MKVFFGKGIMKNDPHFLDGTDTFYIQKFENSHFTQYLYPGDSIKSNLNVELVLLYDKFRDVFFENTDEYYKELSYLPIFIQTAGVDSSCAWTAETFNKWIHKEEYSKLPNFYRHLYLRDCQFLVGTIQNLLYGMENSFISYYTQIVNIGNDMSPSNPDAVMCEMSIPAIFLSSLLESYFTKAYSILDILCKIGHEFQFPEEEFISYRKIKSADLLWGLRKKLQINNAPSTLFEKSELVSLIESIRNEVVHNGTWELNPKVFIEFRNGIPSERYMLFPDISQGHLSTVKNRNHFFGNHTKVNEVLPKIHTTYMQKMLNTVKLLNTSTI